MHHRLLYKVGIWPRKAYSHRFMVSSAGHLEAAHITSLTKEPASWSAFPQASHLLSFCACHSWAGLCAPLYQNVSTTCCPYCSEEMGSPSFLLISWSRKSNDLQWGRVALFLLHPQMCCPPRHFYIVLWVLSAFWAPNNVQGSRTEPWYSQECQSFPYPHIEDTQKLESRSNSRSVLPLL